MSKQIEALKLALEALRDYRRSDDDRVSVAMGILQEALAEQGCDYCNHPQYAGIKCKNCGREQPAQQESEAVRAAWMAGYTEGEREAIEKAQQQEPVAWRWTESNGRHWFDWRTDWTHHDRAKAMGFAIEYAYTSPPASKPWVGLSTSDLDEIDAPIRERGSATIAEIYRAIEAKLREKNNG